MALPFSFSSELRWSDHLNNRQGVFENGTDVYAVLLDKTANTVEVWKSTDSGNSWAEQDSANHKSCYATAGGRCVDATQSGSTLTLTYPTVTTPTINRITFDMSTDTWGTPTASLNQIQNNVSATGAMFVVQRSGDVVLFSNAATETIMGTAYRRVRYMRSGAWNTNVDVGGTGVAAHYDARAAILGSSDRTHFFWTDTTNLDLKHRSLSSANVLGTIQDIDTTVSVGNYSVGLPALNGSTIVLPYKDNVVGTDSRVMVATATSADTPTWTSTIVVSGGVTDPEVANANEGAIAVDGSTVYIFWPNDADQDIYRVDDGGTGTWGTAVEWKDAVTCQGISINKITNAIGVLYDDGGTVKYDAYSLGAPPPPPALVTRRTLLGVGI